MSDDAPSSPREQAVVDAIYASRFDEDDAAHAAWRRALWQLLVDDFFSRWIPADATVLDYGCGKGEFINAVCARRRIAIDVRDSLRASLEPEVEFHLAKGVELSPVQSDTVDVVFCSNLLEHLPDRATVTELLREFDRILSPRGRLLVLGPNIRYTGAAYWDFFDHRIPFTHLSLVEALATAGLQVEKLIPRFLPYTTAGAGLTPLLLVRAYLRVPIAWRFMGAQFFAVARPSA